MKIRTMAKASSQRIMRRQSSRIYLYADSKIRVLLTRNKRSRLFADGDTPNAIVTITSGESIS